MRGIFQALVPFTRFVVLLVANICGCLVTVKENLKEGQRQERSVYQHYVYIPGVTGQSFGFVRPKQVSVDRPCRQIEAEQGKRVRPLHE